MAWFWKQREGKLEGPVGVKGGKEQGGASVTIRKPVSTIINPDRMLPSQPDEGLGLSNKLFAPKPGDGSGSGKLSYIQQGP